MSLSLVQASITDMSFKLNGEPLEWVGSLETPVSLFLTLDNPDNQTSIDLTANLTVLNPKPLLQSQLSEKKLNCFPLKDDSNSTIGFNCSTDLTIIINKPSIIIPFKTVYENGSVFLENKTYNFNIDDSSPEITSIRTDFKYGDYFIVAPGFSTKIYFDVSDTKGSLKFRNLFFKTGSNPTSRVINCSGGSCESYFIGSCEDSTFQVLSVLPSSSDDAGNKFKGVLKTSLKCDNDYPALHGSKPFNILFDNDLYPAPKSGDSIELSLLVDETVSGLIALANFSELNGLNDWQEGSCQKITDKTFNCTWQVSNILSGDNKIYFKIRDGVGHPLFNQTSEEVIPSFSVPIHVDFFQTEDNGSTPNFFLPVIAKTSAPKGYNRIAVDLAVNSGYEFPLFASYDLSRSSVSGSIEVLNSFIDPTSCVLKTDLYDNVSALNFFSDIKVQNPLLDFDKTNRVKFILSPGTDINDLGDEFDIVCNLYLSIRENKKKVYEVPSKTVFETTIKFKNSALGDSLPGEKLVSQIQKQEKRLNTTWKFIGLLDKIAGTISGLCNLDKTLSNTLVGAVSGQMSSFALGAISPAIGGAVNQVSTKLVSTTRRLDSPLLKSSKDSSKSGLRKLLTTACEWSTCSLEKNGKNHQDNFYFTGDSSLQSVFNKDDENGFSGMGQDMMEDLFKDVNVPNPKDSLISSVMSRCWPGVIYNLNKYREIECNALLCMKQQSKAGMDLSVCSTTKSQAICKNVVGEAFDLPYVRRAKNIMNNVDSFVQLIIPNTLKYVTNNLLCSDVINEDKLLSSDSSLSEKIIVIGCNLPESIGTQLNYKVKTSASSTNFQYPVSNDVCAMALCNSPDPHTCMKSNSVVNNWIDDTLQGLGLNSLPGANRAYKPTDKAYSIREYQQMLSDYDKKSTSKLDKKIIISKLRRAGAIKNEADIEKFKKELETNLNLAGNHSGVFLIPSKNGNGFYLSSLNPEDYANKIKKYNKALKNANISPADVNYFEDLDKFKDYESRFTDLNKDIEQLKKDIDNLEDSITFDEGDFYEYDSKILDDETLDMIEDLQKKKDKLSELENKFKSVKETKINLNKKIKNYENKNKDLEDKKSKFEEAKKTIFDKEEVKNDLDKEINLIKEQELSLNDCFTRSCERQKNLLKMQENYYGNLSSNVESGDLSKSVTEKFVKNYEEQELSYQVYDQLEQTADSITSILMSTGILNYGVLSNYGSNTTVGKISDLADTYLNTDNLITGICSPFTKDISKHSNNEDLGAVQCVEGNCRPVLTFGAERVTYDENADNVSYLYTLVYALGPVYDTGLNNEKSYLNYNIYLEPVDGGAKKRLFNITWKQLPLGVPLVDSLSFVGKNKYTKICLKFESPYPPNSWGSKKEFCRSIVDADSGFSSFDTGSPLSRNYEASETGSSTSNNDNSNNPNALAGDI